MNNNTTEKKEKKKKEKPIPPFDPASHLRTITGVVNKEKLNENIFIKKNNDNN